MDDFPDVLADADFMLDYDRDHNWGCFLCHRSDPIKYGTYVRVSWPDGSVKDICDDCVSKADEGEDLDETLDMTEGREGLPEFNGAFR